MEKMNKPLKNSSLNLDLASKKIFNKDNKITETKQSGGSSGKMSLMKAQEVSPNGKV